MSRVWTCRKCRERNPRVKQLCMGCGSKRPAPRKPRHLSALDAPYEEWVARFGERCGICGRAPSARRRLDRDHCHKTGARRGLLCHVCNRSLKGHMDAAWLQAAAAYLERSVAA